MPTASVKRLRLPGLLVAALCVVAPAAAQVGCVTDICHGAVGSAQYVHGPVAALQCSTCHEEEHPNHPTKVVGRDFRLARGGGAALCYGCHERKDANRKVHNPVANGECTACHDPHQSDTELLLKRETVAALCSSCHADGTAGRHFVHGPVANGDCNSCHNPHSAPYDNLTEKEGVGLCLSCHLDRKDEFSRKYIHDPVAADCGGCHDAHSADLRYMLYAEGRDLCYRCHKQMQEHIENSTVQHSALKGGECTGCHTPHSSDHPRQLRAPARTVCFTCHTAMGSQVKGATSLHGPVQQNDCYACHDPHGSNFNQMLKRAFPAAFYVPYRTESYALCFDCHNKELALSEFTTKLTGFRDGNRNLHFLHVNRDPKGRSCKACHEIHAGYQDKHIRKEVPFGKTWKLPVHYTQTASGGRCVVGCHKPREYDRMAPEAR